VVTQADEVWCADVTYIPMASGFAYLVAIMDRKTRAYRLTWMTLAGGKPLKLVEDAQV